MKFVTLKAFEKHLDDADPEHLADLYAVIGKEPYEVKSAVKKLTHLLTATTKNQEFALKTYDANKMILQDLMQELNTLPFFSEKRVVLIENAENLSKADMGALEGYFLNLNRNLCLIISASAINKATNFYKKLEKAGIILDIAEEKSWEKEKSLKEWIFSKVASEKKRISPEAVFLLQKQIGTDQSTMHQELEKLICFIGDRQEITTHDISLLTTSIPTENGWQLMDAIFSRNIHDAFRIAKGLMSSGTALLALIRLIRAQMQTDYQICTILETGGGKEEITFQYPYMKGRILENHIQAAKSYGAARFKKAMLKIDETESAAKNSFGSEDFLLELLITQLVI